MDRHRITLVGLTALGLGLFATPVATQQPTVDLGSPTATDVELSSSSAIRLHFNEQERLIRRASVDALEALYSDYTNALRELRDENQRRVATISNEAQAARRELAESGASNQTRTQRNQEIQERYSREMTDLRAWYSEANQSLKQEYDSTREAMRAELDQTVTSLLGERDAALARLLAAGDSVLVPMEFPTASEPPPLGGAIDTGNESPLADDSRVAASMPDIQLHPLRWDPSGGTRYRHPEAGIVHSYTIDSCSIRVRFSAGYTLLMGNSATEEDISSVAVTGFMKVGSDELIRINERANYSNHPRRLPAPMSPELEEPHGFGWLDGEVELGFGEHVVSAVMDGANRVLETNEANNRQTFRFMIVPEPDSDLDCIPDSIAAAAVEDDSPAGGQAANLGNTGSVGIPDENAARAALSQANLVLALDAPMSERIRVTNTGRTATDAATSMTVTCTDGAGESCVPTWTFADELLEPIEVPALEPDASFEHFIASWPSAIFWGPGTYEFEVQLNANNAVAESARGNLEVAPMVVPDHPTSTIVDYCRMCHTDDNRGIGPAPSMLLEFEEEDGFDTLVQSVIDGPRGMGSKAELRWLPDSRVPEVVRALLDTGR